MASGFETGSDSTLSNGVPLQAWLSTPQQRLLEVTAGAVFHDDEGELTATREALAWYPDELWLWLLACQWRRIDQEGLSWAGLLRLGMNWVRGWLLRGLFAT